MRVDSLTVCEVSARWMAGGCGWTELQAARCQRGGWSVDVGGWSYKLRGVSKVEGWWMRTDGARSCVMSVRLFADGCGWKALQSARCQRGGWPVDAGGWPYSMRGVSEVDGRRMRVDGLTICEMLARRMAGGIGEVV